ncbi:MgtC/SapB family protein, partial [Brachyspira catarrhinii]
PNLDYKNIENIFKSLNINPLKSLSSMREKADLKNI